MMKKQPKRESPFSEQTFFVDGIAAVAEYVRFKPKAIVSIAVSDKARPEVEALLRHHQLKVPIEKRESKVDGAPVVAKVVLTAQPYEEFFSKIKSQDRNSVLALDHITDPRNLGAIVRSAAFFGIKHVIVPERRQVLLTQAAVNTAQGGFAMTDLVVVVNLNRVLTTLKEAGYWVIGTDMGGESIRKVAQDPYAKSVYVLGSEESGMSKSVRDACDRIVSIQGANTGAESTLESLNVAVAAGILLFEFSQSAIP